MKVLIVCSGNLPQINPFIRDQAHALNREGIETDYFLIKGKGITGYLSNLRNLVKRIKENQYDLIHAHYGLSGMLAVLQRKQPVVITFHGTDINSRKNHLISYLASRLSSFNILVIESFIRKIRLTRKFEVIPCGIDSNVFTIIAKHEARLKLNLDAGKKFILFSSRFDNKVKNFHLANTAFNLLKAHYPNAELLELRGYTRSEVNLLMNAVDVLLVTSFTESGPLVVKEAMACNLPIVCTNVGDVQEITQGIPGVYITSYDPDDILEKLKLALCFKGRTDARSRALQFENRLVASKIKNVYSKVIENYHFKSPGHTVSDNEKSR